MQHGPVLGEIDRHAGEHRLALGGHAAGLSELFQQRQDLAVYGAFGIVEQQVIQPGAVALEALGITGKSGSEIGCAGARRHRFEFVDDRLHQPDLLSDFGPQGSRFD
ncbi:hypothetical protein D3C87_1852640 [compost metagenome]